MKIETTITLTKEEILDAIQQYVVKHQKLDKDDRLIIDVSWVDYTATVKVDPKT